MGKKWVSLFYLHAPTISKCIFSDPTFKLRLLELLKVLIPKIESILAAERTAIPPQLIKRAEECFKRLGQEGKHKLNADIHQLITVLHDEEVLKKFGVDLENREQKQNKTTEYPEKFYVSPEVNQGGRK